MSVEEVLEHLEAVMQEAGSSDRLPILPLIRDAGDTGTVLDKPKP